jgi:hypothetical protein
MLLPIDVIVRHVAPLVLRVVAVLVLRVVPLLCGDKRSEGSHPVKDYLSHLTR